jgi:hypothetical protein
MIAARVECRTRKRGAAHCPRPIQIVAKLWLRSAGPKVVKFKARPRGQVLVTKGEDKEELHTATDRTICGN